MQHIKVQAALKVAVVVLVRKLSMSYVHSAEGESTSSLTSAVAVSASTLAEDVRQLAQWCKGADAAREQQEGRLEQLSALPGLQAQIRSLQDKASLTKCDFGL